MRYLLTFQTWVFVARMVLSLFKWANCSSCYSIMPLSIIFTLRNTNSFEIITEHRFITARLLRTATQNFSRYKREHVKTTNQEDEDCVMPYQNISSLHIFASLLFFFFVFFFFVFFFHICPPSSSWRFWHHTKFRFAVVLRGLFG